MDIQLMLKGLISGILAAYLIIYGLRPAVPYPELILEVFENPWMFLMLLIINYYVFLWDMHAGAMLLLCIIALVLDYILFTVKGYKKSMVLNENYKNYDIDDIDDEDDVYYQLRKHTR